jgi:hypothetical protein
MTIFSQPFRFAEAESKSDEFERLLKELGIEIAPGGALEQIHLHVKELADWNTGKTAPPKGEDLRPHFRDLMGHHHLVSLALDLGVERLQPLTAHFELLNVGTPLQNVKAARDDRSGDKVFELLIGLGAVRMGAEVTIDSPNRSCGDNPDVIATWNGVRWGFACKVPSGKAPATLFENVEKGVSQIQHSPSERGFVVLNFKNCFDHEAAMPIVEQAPDGDVNFGQPPNLATVEANLRAFVNARANAMVEHASCEVIKKLFAGKKALPGLLVWLQTTIPLRLSAGIAPGLKNAAVVGSVGVLHSINLERPGAASRLDADADALAKALFHGLRLP